MRLMSTNNNLSTNNHKSINNNMSNDTSNEKYRVKLISLKDSNNMNNETCKENNKIIMSNESHKKIKNTLQTEQIKNTNLQEGGNAPMDIDKLKKIYKMQQYINDMYDKKVKKQ